MLLMLRCSHHFMANRWGNDGNSERLYFGGAPKSLQMVSSVQFSSVQASLVAQRLKHLLGMRETWVGSLGLEDPLEKEMATHTSILAWRIPWMEEPGWLQSIGSQRVRHD